MVLPVVALPLAALRCGGLVNKALPQARLLLRSAPRMALFLAVREDALHGARAALRSGRRRGGLAAKLLTRDEIAKLST